MLKINRPICLIVFLLVLINCFSQDIKERPTVGLVLSGGGAKGFAHVGILKVLEEYNIPIDYIGGTSIGSIIGGLYSVGYSADQLEQMIIAQDWEALFLNEPKRVYMPFYEKEDQDRYQISMDLEEGKLIIPSYAITNSAVIQLFSNLTIGYHEVNDFKKLPTPFFCMAVDFETGKEVMLDSGYLPVVMGASMAIPGVFPSVEIDGKVLVDGGVRNNFPVDRMRAMGVDIIIGIDIGAGMKKGEELKKFGVIIDQLTTMLGQDKFTKNKHDCDVYIKPDIDEYTSADFTHQAAVELIQKGEEKGEECRDEFAKLSKLFEGYDIPKRTGYHLDDSLKDVAIERFEISGSELEDEDVLGIMGIEKDAEPKCTVGDIQEGLDRINASVHFSQSQYKLLEDSVTDNYIMQLDLKECAENTINFGAHYNNQDNVALLFNGTFNSFLFKNSRLSVDVKLSEIPSVSVIHSTNRGSLPGLSFSYGYRSRTVKIYEHNKRVGEAYVSKHYFDVSTNSLVNRFFSLGVGARYEIFVVDDVLENFPLKEANYDYFLYRFFFDLDTKDNVYYPTRGIKCSSHTDVITDNGYELNDLMPSVMSFFSYNQTLSLNSNLAITPSVYAQLQYTDDNPPPLFYDTYVGGFYQPHDIVSQIPFWGLRWGGYHANNVVALGVENRYQVAPKHYLYLNVNALANTEILEDIKFSQLDYKFGVGAGYSYDSFIGPVEIFFSFSDFESIRTFISIGYYF